MSKKEQKETLRKKFLARRRELSKSMGRQKSKAVEKHVLKFIAERKIHSVFTYVSCKSEVDTLPLLKKLLSGGKKVFAPKVISREKQLRFYRIRGVARHLQKGAYDILEPRRAENEEARPQKGDLVLVPGAAFDTRGHRIGYGKGYYDRYLQTLKKNVETMGLCYHDFFMKRLPAMRHDMRVSCVATEKGIFASRKKNDRRANHTKRAA